MAVFRKCTSLQECEVCKGYTAHVTPASSTWPQLVFPHPGNLHLWMVSSVPAQATSSIQIRPVPSQRRTNHKKSHYLAVINVSSGTLIMMNVCCTLCFKEMLNATKKRVEMNIPKEKLAWSDVCIQDWDKWRHWVLPALPPGTVWSDNIISGNQIHNSSWRVVVLAPLFSQ